MPFDVEKIWVFRIIPIQNLEDNLANGLYCKSAGKTSKNFITIGSKEIISERDTRIVKCYPNSVVNDYVPFYFSVRTPMLFNIKTGHGVPAFPQKEIIYLCCKLTELACKDFQWCFTDGNAAKKITWFGNNLKDVETKIDWRSINTIDFRDENSDGDEDRVRKKHAEFLVKNHVPANYIHKVVVINEAKKIEVLKILQGLNLSNIEVLINPKNKFYF